MSKEMAFEGFWQGDVIYACDCCYKEIHFHFLDKEGVDYTLFTKKMINAGWIITKVNNNWHDFCCEECREKYIKNLKNRRK